MNNQSTPDTDEKASPHIGFYSCATVPAEFARKLERERDEAREIAKEAINGLYNLGDYDLAMEEGNKMSDTPNERTLKLALETFTELANTLKQERDEAREEAHRFRSLHYSHLGINGSASWFPWEGK